MELERRAASSEVFVGPYTSFAMGTEHPEREIKFRLAGSAVGGSKCVSSLFSRDAGLGQRTLASGDFVAP